MSDPKKDLFNLAMSDKAQPLMYAVKKHIEDNVAPIMEEFYALEEGKEDRWSWHPRQLELLDGAKAKAKESGLWNFFLPDSETGDGLTNLDYAYIAAELGKVSLASETLNCSAPDTGNMEVLERVGTPEQPTAPAAVAHAVAMLRGLAPMPISLGDTIGHGTPHTVAAMLRAVLAHTPAQDLAGHFHDTGGRAIDNISLSLDMGLRAFDTAVGGLGGCPYAPGALGNVATETVLARLHADGIHTGVDADVSAQAAELAKGMRS